MLGAPFGVTLYTFDVPIFQEKRHQREGRRVAYSRPPSIVTSFLMCTSTPNLYEDAGAHARSPASWPVRNVSGLEYSVLSRVRSAFILGFPATPSIEFKMIPPRNNGLFTTLSISERKQLVFVNDTESRDEEMERKVRGPPPEGNRSATWDFQHPRRK